MGQAILPDTIVLGMNGALTGRTNDSVGAA
jgi:hypothetical protein